MKELIDIAFSPVNLTLTILMLLLIVYWLFNMLSGIDLDLDFDVDMDIDVDADIDIDSDIDLDADSSIEGGNVDFQDIANTEVHKDDVLGKKRKQKLKWWQIILIYFNFVGLPFMFTFTCWIFIWWLTTVITTTITSSFNNSFGFIILLGAIIPSLILTKVFTTPFKKFFASLNQDGDKAIDLVGRKGTINSSLQDDEMGLAEIKVASKTLTVYVKSLGGKFIKQTDEILIIKESSDKNYYYVQSYN